MIRYALALVLALVATEASAGCLHRRCRARPVFRELRVGDVIEYNTPVSAPLPVAPASARAIPPVGYGDAYGFGVWLNGVRARSGLGPLAYDAGLAADAAVNSARGFGHSFLGRARRQNAGVGAAMAVWQMWVVSGPHASALFDRSITRYGIAYVNGVWTYSAN